MSTTSRFAAILRLAAAVRERPNAERDDYLKGINRQAMTGAIPTIPVTHQAVHDKQDAPEAREVVELRDECSVPPFFLQDRALVVHQA